MTSKITLTFTEIVERRAKAVRVRLNATDRSPVWLPLHRVTLDEAARTVTMSQKLAAEKLADAGRDFAAEKRAERDEMIALAPAAWENEKAIGIDCEVVCVHTDQARRTRVFLPKSHVRDGMAPRWLIEAKISETIDRAAGSYPRSALMVEGLTA